MNRTLDFTRFVELARGSKRHFGGATAADALYRAWCNELRAVNLDPAHPADLLAELHTALDIARAGAGILAAWPPDAPTPAPVAIFAAAAGIVAQEESHGPQA